MSGRGAGERVVRAEEEPPPSPSPLCRRHHRYRGRAEPLSPRRPPRSRAPGLPARVQVRPGGFGDFRKSRPRWGLSSPRPAGARRACTGRRPQAAQGLGAEARVWAVARRRETDSAGSGSATSLLRAGFLSGLPRERREKDTAWARALGGRAPRLWGALHSRSGEPGDPGAEERSEGLGRPEVTAHGLALSGNLTDFFCGRFSGYTATDREVLLESVQTFLLYVWES